MNMVIMVIKVNKKKLFLQSNNRISSYANNKNHVRPFDLSIVVMIIKLAVAGLIFTITLEFYSILFISLFFLNKRLLIPATIPSKSYYFVTNRKKTCQLISNNHFHRF